MFINSDYELRRGHYLYSVVLTLLITERLSQLREHAKMYPFQIHDYYYALKNFKYFYYLSLLIAIYLVFEKV